MYDLQIGDGTLFTGFRGIKGRLVAPAVVEAVLRQDLEIQIIGSAGIVEVDTVVELPLIEDIAERIHRIGRLGIF